MSAANGGSPGPKILVVDDEENVLLTITTILGDRGYAVETASGGREAIARIRKEPFDLVLTDLSMKECDGLEVLAAVREHSSDTVAIMLTGYATLDSAIEAIRRGAYDYLTKPTNIDEMVQAIERGLEKRRLTLELRRRVDELTTLNRLANVAVDAVLRSTGDMGKALERIAEIVTELFGPAASVLFLADDDGRLAPRARHASSPTMAAALGDGALLALAEEALRSRAPVPGGAPPLLTLAVPIEWQERRLGALAVARAGRRAWTEEQVQTASTIAGRAALAIVNAELYREVLDEKETLGLILNAAGDGIIGLDRDDRIVFFSRAAERLTGWKEADVRGRPFGPFVSSHPTTEPIAAIRGRAAEAAGGLTSGEILLRGAGPGGTRGGGCPPANEAAGEIFCDVLCCELPEGEGGRVRAVLSIHDARERRRLEEQKTSLISHITHELKTPLTSILAYTYLINGAKLGPVSERQSDALAVMRRNAQHLLTLIENMLTTAQISQGIARYRFEPVQLTDVLTDAHECFAPVATERQIDFTVERDADIVIAADKQMLAMAVNNLLANAMRFTDRNGRVLLAVRDRGPEVAIEVHDTGVGIPEEFHERVFQRYFQIDRSRGGSGLGLEIVKSIAEAHGGRVSLESRSGEGAHFFITIPKARPVQAAAGEPQKQQQQATASAK